MTTLPRRSAAPLTPDQAEMVADMLKERIYATITLLALLTVMWQNPQHHTVMGSIGAVAGTSVALLLAISISANMAHQVVHGQPMTATQQAHLLRTHSALLLPAIPVVVILLGSLSALYSIEAALTVSIILLLLSFVLFSFMAGRSLHNSFKQIVTASLLEIGLGIAIIALKVMAGH